MSGTHYCYSNRSSWNPGSWCSCVCSLTHKTHSNIVSDKITPPPSRMATPLNGLQFVKASPISFNLILIGSGAFWGQVDTSSCFFTLAAQIVMMGIIRVHWSLGGFALCAKVFGWMVKKDSGFPSRIRHCNETINVYRFNRHWCWPGCSSKHRDW